LKAAEFEIFERKREALTELLKSSAEESFNNLMLSDHFFWHFFISIK